MVSDASKKKAAQKKAAAAAKRGGKSSSSSSKAAVAAAASHDGIVDSVTNGVGSLVISDRTCTGVLCSHPLSRDIRVSSLLLCRVVLWLIFLVLYILNFFRVFQIYCSLHLRPC